MLITNAHTIGLKLYEIRKSKGLTQSEAAERAGLSDRTFADIERGTVNMRVDTLVKICTAFSITPNQILTSEIPNERTREEITRLLDSLPQKEQRTALKILSAYMDTI